MSQSTALNLALQALNLAVESGGELDRNIYVEAKQKIELLVREVVAYAEAMDAEERVPEGDDYNQLLSILEINY